MKRGQSKNCESECSSLEGALSCSTTECVCPILNQASSSAIQTCANCLEKSSGLAMYAEFLPLLGDVCSTCETQCSALLNAIITQVPSCSGTPISCACSIIGSLSPADIASCTCCIQTFDPTDVSGVLSLENQCGVTLPLPMCSAASGNSPTSTFNPTYSVSTAPVPAPAPVYTTTGTVVTSGNASSQFTTSPVSTTAELSPSVVITPNSTTPPTSVTTTSSPSLATVSQSDAWKSSPYPFGGIFSIILCVEILVWLLLGEIV